MPPQWKLPPSHKTSTQKKIEYKKWWLNALEDGFMCKKRWRYAESMQKSQVLEDIFSLSIVEKKGSWLKQV